MSALASKWYRSLYWPLLALSRMAQGRHEEAIIVERVDSGGRGVGHVLALLVLYIVGVLPAGDALLSRLGPAVGTEEGLPVLGHGENDIGALKRGLKRGDVVELGGHDLDALFGQVFFAAGESTLRVRPRTRKRGILQETLDHGAALVAGSADDADELLPVGHGCELEQGVSLHCCEPSGAVNRGRAGVLYRHVGGHPRRLQNTDQPRWELLSQGHASTTQPLTSGPSDRTNLRVIWLLRGRLQQ